MHRAWHIGRWILLALVLLYAADVIYAYPYDHEARISESMVARIAAQKLTMAEVDGKHLPPPPDAAQVDATIAGIDANDNGIRDDVELAIFAKYPISSATSTAIRAAELQYAMELQMEFKNVIDSATLVAVIQQEGRGFLCISNDQRAEEVENLQVDTQRRKSYREEIRKKYMASFGIDSSDFCDIN